MENLPGFMSLPFMDNVDSQNPIAIIPEIIANADERISQYLDDQSRIARCSHATHDWSMDEALDGR